MIPELREVFNNSDLVGSEYKCFFNFEGVRGRGVDMLRVASKRRRTKIEILEAKAQQE
jgi:predicted transcriptional regulator